jgi:hypothetical protein
MGRLKAWGTKIRSVRTKRSSPKRTSSLKAGCQWTSTENNNNNAWNQRFSDGNQNNNNKNNALAVRCVRS